MTAMTVSIKTVVTTLRSGVMAYNHAFKPGGAVAGAKFAYQTGVRNLDTCAMDELNEGLVIAAESA